MQIDWAEHPHTVELVCPVCSSREAKQVRLTVDPALAGQPRLRLLDCAACGSAFYEDMNHAPYEVSSLGDGLLKYYLELGAGLDTMIAPLYRINFSQVQSYLEIGCGFGFSLDFARYEFGWTVKGLDPSPLAATGRDELGLDIAAAYLSADTDFGARFDLVLCSEVIEHLPAPAEVIRLLARTLASDGSLIVTTPNVRALRREASFGTTLAILAPSFHLVLYSPESLAQILKANGFPHVRVWEHANTLHAVASLRPAGPSREATVDRAALRRYLGARVKELRPDSPAAGGLTYRLFKELVNASAFRDADPVYAALRDSWRRVYQIDLDAPDTILFETASQLTFDDFSKRYPFNLCCTLYFKGICEFVDRQDYPSGIRYFRAAVRAGTVTATQLASVFTADGELENLIWQAEIHILFGLATVDETAAVAGFFLLVDPPPPGGTDDRFQRLPTGLVETTRNDLFVRLVVRIAGDTAKLLVPGARESSPGGVRIRQRLVSALEVLAGDRHGRFSRFRLWLRAIRAVLVALTSRLRGRAGRD